MVSRCHILVVITTSILTIGLAWAGSSNNSLYTRCAACHLPSGAGVPGIYPPLKGNLNKFFASELGREYIAQVVVHGVRGKMQVDGLTYRGAMASVIGGLNSQRISALLNELVERFGNAEQKRAAPLFTAGHVDAVKKQPASNMLVLRSKALREFAE